MKISRITILFVIVMVIFSITFLEENDKKVRVLLVGDSTTIGNLPRQVNPEGPHLEKMIKQLAVVEGLPTLEVINTGKGGETAKRLPWSKWYKERLHMLRM